MYMDELKKLMDEMPPVMEYEFKDIKETEREIMMILEISSEMQTISSLMVSPNLSRQTVDSLGNDLVRLTKKFNLITCGGGKEGGA